MQQGEAMSSVYADEIALNALANAEDAIRKGNEAIRKKMAPKGKLGLPDLLEQRRWDELIPDSAFKFQAAFDRVLVMQTSGNKSKTFVEGGVIQRTHATIEREEDEASRGVLVSAGLGALDTLRSNGIDVGHYVRFIRNAPWRMKIDNVEGQDIWLLVMRDGDLVASEDTAEALRNRKCKVAWNDEAKQHEYVDAKGKHWKPKSTWIADDV